MTSAEWTVRLQFLDEAQEYLRTIEAVLLASKNASVEVSRIDAALRAAHSIKGGAGMMGFMQLSEASHRLEDAFKIIRARRTVLDTDLQSLLLSGVDTLGQIASQNGKGTEVDADWFASRAEPIFASLRERLGEVSMDDEARLIDEDDPQAVLRVLFETEVEGCLQRLEGLLAGSDQACLRTELELLAQELADLGEMLQLEKFTALCQTVYERIQLAPDDLLNLSHQALKAWRRSQALILAGAVESISADFEEGEAEFLPTFPTSSPASIFDEGRTKSALVQAESVSDEGTARTNTVRVPIERLEVIGDLWAELLIGRNSLDLHLGRLRKQVGALIGRVQQLEEVNQQLRTTYDQAATLPSETAVMPAEADNFDSLEMDRYNSLHPLWQESTENTVWVQEVSADIDISLQEAELAAYDLGRATNQLQTDLKKLRMRPLSDVTDRFNRAIHNFSKEFGKAVSFKVHGGSTLVDLKVIEALGDPLMHLVRNAFDHGIESPDIRQAKGKPNQGTIEIRATQRGNVLLMTVRDDGSGLDDEKIRARALQMGLPQTQILDAEPQELHELIFEPGFSTASQVTSLSGRGVGMDVVRTQLQTVNGTIAIHSQPSQGTTFTLSIPLNLSVLRALVVEIRQMLFAFPGNSVEKMLILDPDCFSVDGRSFDHDGSAIPVVPLDQWLHYRCPTRPIEAEENIAYASAAVLIVSGGDAVVCVPIDRCWGEREVAIRALEGPIQMPPGFKGCTVLGNGQAVPIVDVPDLIAWMSQCSSSIAPHPSPPLAQQKTLLVVDDSINVRRMLALTLEKVGYRVEQARDGLEALEKLNSGLWVEGVICDLEMPRLDGFGFLARLRTNNQKLPVAMLTSRNGEKHRKMALSLGANAYFSKPYREAEFLDSLEKMISQSTATPPHPCHQQ
ncbi:MAG: hybrid sensor histidine kinase/response regulator [Anaerolineae bacterium]|nr:hybrid sensor histidine kinase/response regulator [Gloeobacterales cyanobacterium ES-bin-313]